MNIIFMGWQTGGSYINYREVWKTTMRSVPMTRTCISRGFSRTNGLNDLYFINNIAMMRVRRSVTG